MVHAPVSSPVSAPPAAPAAGPVPGAVRYAALGDSITVGLGDGVSMGAKHPDLTGRGFAAVLAASYGGPAGRVAFVNLATTGATFADVHGSQLPAALRWRPTVASLVAGMNDVLDPRFDAARTGADVARCVAALRASGAVVLTARFHDPAPLLMIPKGLRRVLLARIAALNDAVDAAARDDAGVLVLDLGDHPEVYDRSSWDVDRVHPGPRGHRVLARGFADLLAAAGLGPEHPPEVPAPSAGPGTLAHAWWLARVGLPWLATRRGSILPGLAVAARAMVTGGRAGGPVDPR